MKKNALLIAFISFPLLTNAQDFFNSYEDQRDVTFAVINKSMIRLLTKIDIGDEEAQNFLEMAKGIDNIKVIMTESPQKEAKIKADVEKYVGTSNGLEELMRVKDEGQSIKFYSREGKDESHVSELLMFLNGEIEGKKGTVLLSITGDVNLNDISKLTKQLNVPGSENLNKIEKKN